MRLRDKKIRAKQIVLKIFENITDKDTPMSNAWLEGMEDDDELDDVKKEWEDIIIKNLPNGEDDKDK